MGCVDSTLTRYQGRYATEAEISKLGIVREGNNTIVLLSTIWGTPTHRKNKKDGDISGWMTYHFSRISGKEVMVVENTTRLDSYVSGIGLIEYAIRKHHPRYVLIRNYKRRVHVLPQFSMYKRFDDPIIPKNKILESVHDFHYILLKDPNGKEIELYTGEMR